VTERGGTPPTTDELSLSAPVATPPSHQRTQPLFVWSWSAARVDTINIFARYLGGVRALCVRHVCVMCLCVIISRLVSSDTSVARVQERDREPRRAPRAGRRGARARPARAARARGRGARPHTRAPRRAGSGASVPNFFAFPALRGFRYRVGIFKGVVMS